MYNRFMYDCCQFITKAVWYCKMHLCVYIYIWVYTFDIYIYTEKTKYLYYYNYVWENERNTMYMNIQFSSSVNIRFQRNVFQGRSNKRKISGYFFSVAFQRWLEVEKRKYCSYHAFCLSKKSQQEGAYSTDDQSRRCVNPSRHWVFCDRLHLLFNHLLL